MPPSPIRPLLAAGLTLTALAALLSACGGGGGGSTAVTPPVTQPVTPPQTVSLALSGSPMLGSAPLTLNANLDHSADVNWTLAGGNPGSLSASSGASVSYTPPATRVSSITPVTITATSAGVSKSVHLSLYPDPGTPGLSLLAGSLGGHAIIDGSGTDARFNNIAAMAADSAGGMVVADLGDTDTSANPVQTPSTIRQVSEAGKVNTLASPAFGHADGKPGQAKLGTVMALAVAPNGNIYLIDNDTSRSYLRVLSPDGSLSTLATLPAGSSFASGLKLVYDDSSGIVNVMILSSSALYTVKGGTPILMAGSEQGGGGSVDGTSSAARFIGITDAVGDGAGNVYVIDNFSVRKITQAGEVSTLAGVAAASTSPAIDGSGSVARFGQPTALAVAANGNLLVLDRDVNGGRSGYQIRQVTLAGAVSTPYSGADPKSYGFAPPLATATPDTRLRVSSSGAIVLASVGQLQLQQNASSASQLAGLEGDSGDEQDGQGAAARFLNPGLLASDLSGNVYVMDTPQSGGGSQIEKGGILLRKISASGLVSTIPTIDSQQVPSAMGTDGDGNLYITTRGPFSGLTGVAPGGVVLKVTPQGSASILAGNMSLGGSPAPADGAGAAAAFIQPTLKGLDADGNLYISDLNNRVTPATTSYRKVTPQGVVSTIAALPAGLNTVPDGYTYSADPDRSVVYRLAADDSKTVVAGVPLVRGTRLGALPGGLDRPANVVPTGPGSFAVISGAAVLRLVLPH